MVEEGYFREYFQGVSDRERCIFECGIKLGGIFHQFVGTPVSLKSKGSLEKAIEEAVKNQPFVEDVKIRLDEDFFSRIKNEFDYIPLNGNMLDVTVVVSFGSAKCRCKMRYIKERDYPLMYIEKISEKNK